jgi:hypothetical protein
MAMIMLQEGVRTTLPQDARAVFVESIVAIGLPRSDNVYAFLSHQAGKLARLSPEIFNVPLDVNSLMAHVITYPIDDLLLEEKSKLRLAIMLVQEARATGTSAEKFRASWPRDVAEYIDWLDSSGITAEPTFRYHGSPATQSCNFIFASEQDAIHFKFRWL